MNTGGATLHSGSAELEPGEWLEGKYRIVRELGRGGMGIVYEALHIELDVPVAIKVLRPEFVDSFELSERLLQEARAAGRIQSEHAVRVLDFGKLAGRYPFIVMEYLEGESLGARLERLGPLPLFEIVDAVTQATRAIAEAHARDIVHRDLKPENLFAAERADGTRLIKVVDFGISKEIRQGRNRNLTNPMLTLGSPDYMSPEQMHATTRIDGRADVWSLGVVLYELATGRTPFTAPTLAQIFANVSLGKFIPPSQLVRGLPVAFDHVVARCLALDPAARFQSAAELAEALRGLGTTRGEVGVSQLVRRTSFERTAALPIPGVPLPAANDSAAVTVAARRLRFVGAALLAASLGIVAWLWPDEPSLDVSSPVLQNAVPSPAKWSVSVAALPPALPPFVLDDPELEPIPKPLASRRPRRHEPASTPVTQLPNPVSTPGADLPTPVVDESQRAWDPRNFGGRN